MEPPRPIPLQCFPNYECPVDGTALVYAAQPSDGVGFTYVATCPACHRPVTVYAEQDPNTNTITVTHV